MDIFEQFSVLFLEVWKKGILGVDIFQILIGLGIFLIFLLFRGLISKIIIGRLKKIAAKTTNKLDDTFVQAMEGPARFFPIVIGFFIASYYLEFSSETQTFIDNLNKKIHKINNKGPSLWEKLIDFRPFGFQVCQPDTTVSRSKWCNAPRARRSGDTVSSTSL